jgi:hypothetical protein
MGGALKRARCRAPHASATLGTREPRAPRPIPEEMPLSWPRHWVAALRCALLADEGTRGQQMPRSRCIDRAPTDQSPGLLTAGVRISVRRAPQPQPLLNRVGFASLTHPARRLLQDCMSTLWRKQSRQIPPLLAPSTRLSTPSSRGLFACAMRRAISAWTRTASIARSVRDLNSCPSAPKESRSIGLNLMRGRRIISLATGATWLKPKGASHGTR